LVPDVGVIVPLEAVQVTVPPGGVVFAVKFRRCPSTSPPRFGVIVTAETLVIVIVAAAVFVPSATDAAVSVTEGGVGAVAGAEYVTGVPEALLAAESVPHVVPLQPVPDSVQATPLFSASFATVAANDVVVLMGTVAEVAERATETFAAAASVIAAAAVLVASAIALAVSVTVAGLGIAAGAV
jgi:hypothetical protein